MSQLETRARVPAPSSSRRFRRFPAFFVALALASGVVALLAEDWIAGVAIWVLWAGWHCLRREDGPPVLAMAYTFQWVQVTIGMYYHAFTGADIGALDVRAVGDYRTMMLLGLGCLLALLAGLKGGIWLVERWRGRQIVGPEDAFTWRTLILLYVASIALTGSMQELAWRIPVLTQGILALTYARFALLFLVFRRLTRPHIRWAWIAGILGGELALGSTGYFAGFREPIMLAAVAVAGAFDRHQVKHWMVVGGLGGLAILTGVLWIGIRKDFRQDFESEVFAQSREARLERIAELAANWTERAPEEMLQDVRYFVMRMWSVHYPALALLRVPSQVPHEDGAILWRALTHLVTPRLLFPDKPPLQSDSEMVFRYAGVLVAGAGPRATGGEGDTSIAFGYAGEAYVDFGVPLMFLPVFVYGLVMGALYRWLLGLIRHRELAIAVTTVCFWLSLYLFERSWIKMLGLSMTLIIYLGGATVWLDRILLRQARLRGRSARVMSMSRPRLPLPPRG